MFRVTGTIITGSHTEAQRYIYNYVSGKETFNSAWDEFMGHLRVFGGRSSDVKILGTVIAKATPFVAYPVKGTRNNVPVVGAPVTVPLLEHSPKEQTDDWIKEHMISTAVPCMDVTEF